MSTAASDTASGQPAQAAPAGPFAAVGEEVLSALGQVRSTGDAEAEAALALVHKICANVALQPEEDKFRRVKKGAAAVQAHIVGVPGAAALLHAFGFGETSGPVQQGPADGGQIQEDFFVLPQGAPLHANVLKAVERELLTLQAKHDASKAAQLEALGKAEAARAEAAREKERIAAQIRADREERRREEEIKGVHASKAVERKFGAEPHRTSGVGHGWA